MLHLNFWVDLLFLLLLLLVTTSSGKALSLPSPSVCRSSAPNEVGVGGAEYSTRCRDDARDAPVAAVQ